MTIFNRFALAAATLFLAAAPFLSPGAAGVTAAQARRGGAAPAAKAGERPNVLVIILDDLGFADVSAYKKGRIPTPNIDRLAREGVLFTQGYTSAPICSPSRAGLMTGRHQQRFGFEYNNGPGNLDRTEHRGLDPREKTIGDVLKTAGYRTGIIGKWHLGWNDEHYPTNRGFDYFWGLLTGQTNFMRPDAPGVVNAFAPSKPGESRELVQPYQVVGETEQIVTGPNRTIVPLGDRHLTDMITDEAIRFIDTSGPAPFFLYLAHPAPHTPLQATREWYDRFPDIASRQNRVYAAMVAQADAGIGRVLAHLEATGKARNTIVVLLSDNGCAAYIEGLCSPEPLSGGKLTYLEGGVRVPFMLRWPARVKGGQVFDRPVSSLDIMPTLAHAAGAALPSDRVYDGQDILAALGGKAAPRTLYWRTQPIAAVREGDWKFIRDLDGNEFLYNLRKDPRETRNLIASQTRRAEIMRAAHAAWSAQMAQPGWKPRKMEYVFGGRTFKFSP
jgi:arylsulfatase A-like enzyme